MFVPIPSLQPSSMACEKKNYVENLSKNLDAFAMTVRRPEDSYFLWVDISMKSIVFVAVYAQPQQGRVWLTERLRS